MRLATDEADTHPNVARNALKKKTALEGVVSEMAERKLVLAVVVGMVAAVD